MSKIKNGGSDQYGAGPFEQQQFGTAGVEGVNIQQRRLAMTDHHVLRMPPSYKVVYYFIPPDCRRPW